MRTAGDWVGRWLLPIRLAPKLPPSPPGDLSWWGFQRTHLVDAMRYYAALLLPALILGCATQNPAPNGWIDLFDGESLAGWTASENASTFSVQDGAIVAQGDRSHLFYTGPVEDHDFTNFELMVEVMTRPGSNSGIYFHTEYQDEGWPAKGYEAQINNTSGDTRKTGSLYAIEDVAEPPVNDDAWFTYHIVVQGNRITVALDGETVVDYTEPEGVDRPDDMSGRRLSSGTFALQGHDPESTVYFRNIRVKPLP